MSNDPKTTDAKISPLKEGENRVSDQIEKAKGDMASSNPGTRQKGEENFSDLQQSEGSNGFPPASDRVAHRRH